MKKFILFLFVFSITIAAQSLPTSGKSYTIKYDPSEKNIFNTSSRLTLVYTFDYWGTKVAAIHGAEKLFENVLSPDEGRISKVPMTLKGSLFEANIFISDSAQLLSYYFADGNNFDYNDKKTYISYIYGQSGKPVKGARFRNIDFLVMSGADNRMCIEEIENELKDYPDYHLARYVLWNKKYENEKDFNGLLSLRDDFEKEFAELKIRYPNDYELLNSEGKGYYAFQMALNNTMMPYYRSASEKILEIAKQIPEGKRASIIQRVYESDLQQKKSIEFNEGIVGKPSINFEFKSIKGEQKKLIDFKGKVVLLDFWGTWCGPCVGEIPNLVNAYEKFKEKGFEIISISSDLMMQTKTEEEFKSFTQEKNMSWTHVLDDKNKTIHTLYNIAHWPTLYLLDQNGTIIKNEKVLRGAELEKTLNEVFGMN
ncbi:MAG: TlpA family protein disulfide reductase [Ignavibacteriales bacterium]|nr:MAG: TlpA family protein disulfide reductase [Ignavibacteriales bacterium]